mmetsp:Transcript_6396/g.10607  ORF Transcript_6396/g.10607 Transcript_6396/m.10607 type:complete len:371 (+) Transcript_6396:126-1238(+)
MVVSLPTLYILATKHKYDELIRCLDESNDESVDWADMHGNTVLHILCRQSLLSKEAIQAVVEKRPSLVGQYNHAYWTPLHLACEKRRHQARTNFPKTTTTITEILLLLIHACPQGVSQRRESGYARETPLDMVCAFQDPDLQVLTEMLRIDPGLALPPHFNDGNRNDNLNVLWKNKLTKHMELLLLTALLKRVAVVAVNNDDADDTKFLLHAACLQRVPRDYLEEIMEQHKDHLLLPGPHNGNLPLHYAVYQQDNIPPHFVDYLVTTLVTHAPEAVKVFNHDGRYPLHCALGDPNWEQQHNPFLKNATLLKLLCRPVTLGTIDPVTRLYPLQMAARYANLSRAHHNTLYEVILAAPQVVCLVLQQTTVGT